MSEALMELDPLKRIGRDPFRLVLSYLKVKELLRCELVSKEWKDVCLGSWSQQSYSLTVNSSVSNEILNPSVPKKILDYSEKTNLERIWMKCGPYLTQLIANNTSSKTFENILTLLEKTPGNRMEFYDLFSLDDASFQRFLDHIKTNRPEKIKSLNLSSVDVEKESFISTLALCTSLQYLVLDTASEALFQAIPNSLLSLEIRYDCDLEGDCLSLLNTPSLLSLKLKWRNRNALDLAPLRNCKQLQLLEIDTGYYDYVTSVGSLAGLPLEALNFNYDSSNFLDLISRALDAPIQNTLKRLNIPYTLVTSCNRETLQSIAVFVALEELDLTCSALDGETMSVIAQNCPRLRSLQLISTKINDVGLECIGKHCKELRTLELDECSQVSDKGILSLLERFQPSQHESDPCSQLTFLSISGTKVTDLALACIGKKCKKLQILEIYDCSLLTDQAMVNLLETDDKGATIGDHLKTLRAGETKIGDKSIGVIGEKCTKLEELQLANAPISDMGVDQLVNLSTKKLPLNYLNIGGTAITDKSLALIGRKYLDLEFLDVRECEKITDAGIELLAAARFPPNRKTSNLPILTIDCEDTAVTDREFHPKIKL